MDDPQTLHHSHDRAHLSPRPSTPYAGTSASHGWGSDDIGVPLHTPAIVAERRDTNVISFWRGGHVRLPVLAWLVEDGVATPVTFEMLPDVWCLEVTIAGSTSWAFPYTRRFVTFEEAERHAATLLPANDVVERQRDVVGHPLALVEATWSWDAVIADLAARSEGLSRG